MERDEIRGLLLKFRNLLFFFRQPLKLQLKAKLGLVWDLLEENTAKHANSALDVCLRVEVTSCASPSHPSPLFPIVAWSGIPVLSHQQGLIVVSLLCLVPPGCSIKGLEQAVPLPCKPHFQGIPESWGWCESDHRERIPSLSLDPFFFLTSLFFIYSLLHMAKPGGEKKRKKAQVCRGEKRGVIVNVCCPWLVAQQFCGMWDSLLQGLPCSYATVSGGCCRKGCAWAGEWLLAAVAAQSSSAGLAGLCPPSAPHGLR